MDWKDGLTTIIVVGLGYYGLTKVVKGPLYHADSPLTDGEGRIAPNECPYCGEDENWAELTHDEGGSWDCYYCGTLTYDAESFSAEGRTPIEILMIQQGMISGDSWDMPKEMFPKYYNRNEGKRFHIKIDSATIVRDGDSYSMFVKATEQMGIKNIYFNDISWTMGPYPYTADGWFNGYMRWAQTPMKGRDWATEVQANLGDFTDGYQPTAWSGAVKNAESTGCYECGQDYEGDDDFRNCDLCDVLLCGGCNRGCERCSNTVCDSHRCSKDCCDGAFCDECHEEEFGAESFNAEEKIIKDGCGGCGGDAIILEHTIECVGENGKHKEECGWAIDNADTFGADYDPIHVEKLKIQQKLMAKAPNCEDCGKKMRYTPMEYRKYTCWPCVDRAGGSYHGTECYCSQCMSYENYAESFSAEIFEARYNQDGTIVLTDNEWNSCLHMTLNNCYLWRNKALLEDKRTLKSGNKFKVIETYTDAQVALIRRYEGIFGAINKRKNAESFEAEEWWEEWREELEAVDISSLDDMELMWWNEWADVREKYGKAKTLQIIINTAEYSTRCSDQLAKIARKQEVADGWSGYDIHEAESFSADDWKLDRYIESRKEFKDNPNKANIISDNPKREGESMAQWERRLHSISDEYGAESHAYTYAYNEGHSDSRKTGEYRPSLSTGSQEASFKRILKQKGD